MKFESLKKEYNQTTSEPNGNTIFQTTGGKLRFQNEQADWDKDVFPLKRIIGKKNSLLNVAVCLFFCNKVLFFCQSFTFWSIFGASILSAVNNLKMSVWRFNFVDYNSAQTKVKRKMGERVISSKIHLP